MGPCPSAAPPGLFLKCDAPPGRRPAQKIAALEVAQKKKVLLDLRALHSFKSHTDTRAHTDAHVAILRRRNFKVANWMHMTECDQSATFCQEGFFFVFFIFTFI